MSALHSREAVAVLGLGIMGSGMARRLLGAGYAVTVYNRSPARAEPLAAAGARVAGSPREAAAGADVILSMVADDEAARAVWLGAEGALDAAEPGAICIESSTVTPGWIKELFAAAHARRCRFLEAPVTGSRPQAAAGELNFLVGGAPDLLEQVRPLLAAMSRTITLLGPVGSGALVKLANNFLCGVQAAALAEAIAMIERTGIDRGKAVEVLTGGAGGSPIVKTLSARMTAPDYTPNFLLRLMAKDLSYVLKTASAHSLDLRTARAALAVFEQAIAAGRGDQDMAAIIEPLRQ